MIQRIMVILETTDNTLLDLHDSSHPYSAKPFAIDR